MRNEYCVMTVMTLQRLSPLPVRRERVRVRVLLNPTISLYLWKNPHPPPSPGVPGEGEHRRQLHLLVTQYSFLISHFFGNVNLNWFCRAGSLLRGIRSW